MEIAFWSCALFVVYTYGGYPLLVWALARLRSTPPDRPVSAGSDETPPSVTVLVAVHNERERVAAKVNNLLASDYPAEQLSILVCTDGCTDGTETAVPSHPRARVVGYPQRLGKPSALNYAMQFVTSDIVVFTDARQEFEPQAIATLVRTLSLPGVGAVSGELMFRSSAHATAGSVGAYWTYEKFIRANESRLSSTVGVTGAIYATRRRDWEPLPDDVVLDDVLVPMRIARRGLRVLFEPGAIAWDHAASSLDGERRRKLRTLAGNYQLVRGQPWLLSPFGNPLWLQFWSHKLFRLLVPYALVGMLVTAALAQSSRYQALFLVQTALYAVGLLGIWSPALRRQRVFNIAALFLDLNFAAVSALFIVATGALSVRWAKS